MKHARTPTLPPLITDPVANRLAGDLMRGCWGVEESQLKRRPTIKMTSLISRQRAVKSLAATFGPLLIDVIGSDEMYKARFLSFQARELDDKQEALLASLYLFDGRTSAETVFGDAAPEPMYMVRAGTFCVISKHAIARVIQAKHSIDVAAILKTLTAGLSWASAANYVGHSGSFMVPVREGLLGCGMDIDTGDTVAMSGAGKVANIRTFISHDRMRKDSRQRWQRMVDKGALESQPRAVKRSAVTDAHMDIFKIMAEEGHAFDARKAHAIETQRIAREKDLLWTRARAACVAEDEDCPAMR